MKKPVWDKSYVRLMVVNIIAILSNVGALILQVRRGRWFLGVIHVLVIVMVITSFLCYRKSRKKLLEWKKLINEGELK